MQCLHSYARFLQSRSKEQAIFVSLRSWVDRVCKQAARHRPVLAHALYQLFTTRWVQLLITTNTTHGDQVTRIWTGTAGSLVREATKVNSPKERRPLGRQTRPAALDISQTTCKRSYTLRKQCGLHAN